MPKTTSLTAEKYSPRRRKRLKKKRPAPSRRKRPRAYQAISDPVAGSLPGSVPATETDSETDTGREQLAQARPQIADQPASPTGLTSHPAGHAGRLKPARRPIRVTGGGPPRKQTP
jgi:hypothetical protein